MDRYANTCEMTMTKLRTVDRPVLRGGGPLESLASIDMTAG